MSSTYCVGFFCICCNVSKHKSECLFFSRESFYVFSVCIIKLVNCEHTYNKLMVKSVYLFIYLVLGQSDSGHHAGRTQQTDKWNSSTEIWAGITDQEEECLGAGKCYSARKGVSIWPAEGEFVIKNVISGLFLIRNMFLHYNVNFRNKEEKKAPPPNKKIEFMVNCIVNVYYYVGS